MIFESLIVEFFFSPNPSRHYFTRTILFELNYFGV